MAKHYDTTIGGKRKTFPKTSWSEVRGAKTPDRELRKEIVGNLIRKYWKPVHYYLRCKGYDNEQAKDLTQGFFHEVVLGRELIQKAEKSKGRFRTLLLTALDRYITDVHRKETAKKRSPAGQILQMDEIDSFGEREIPAGVTPDEAFLYAWASDLLDEVIRTVENEFHDKGKSTHWQVFQAGVLEPIVDSVDRPSLKDICIKYDVESESKASNMIVTVERRFRAVLKQQLRKFVQSGSEIEDELSELIRILSKNIAG